MKHKWSSVYFETGVMVDGELACVQHWRCSRCGCTSKVPYGFEPTGPDCHERQKLMETVKDYKGGGHHARARK